jgi:hypothetical protein
MSSESLCGGANPRNSRLEHADHEMTDELSIHTSMLRGYGETKLQNTYQLQRQESEVQPSSKLVALTVDQFTGSASSATEAMKRCLVEDLQKHNINYLTAAYFLTLKHEDDEC